MTQILLSSAAWYIIPKGIEYATSRPPSLESRVDRIRARLFTYKSSFTRFVAMNAPLQLLNRLASVYYPNMWLAVLITACLQRTMPKLDFMPWHIITCHLLFIYKPKKPDWIKLMNSNAALEYTTSKWGLRCINVILSLRFTKAPLLGFIKKHLPECPLSDQLVLILGKRLRPSDAYELLRAKSFPIFSERLRAMPRIYGKFNNSLSALDRIRAYDSSAADELFHSIFSDEARMRTANGNSLEGRPLDNVLIGTDIISLLKDYKDLIAKMQSVRQQLADYAEDIHDTDPILNRIQCPISLRAPRRTITDPTNRKTVYDYEAFKIWLEHERTSPITRKEIFEDFDLNYEGGSRYDSILRYRKACLGSESLQDPKEFITRLRQVFTEISQLNHARETKDASEAVRDFFQKGFLNAYDVSYLKNSDPYEVCKRKHNKDLNEKKDEGDFTSILIKEIDQSPFILKELNLEIEKIKIDGQILIQDFL